MVILKPLFNYSCDPAEFCPYPEVGYSSTLMDSMSHHIPLVVNLAQAGSLSLATRTILMNVLSERQIRKRDFMASWNQGHDRQRRRMLWWHREWALTQELHQDWPHGVLSGRETTGAAVL